MLQMLNGELSFVYTQHNMCQFVTRSIKTRNQSEKLSLAIPLHSARTGEFGCDGRFSGVDVFN